MKTSIKTLLTCLVVCTVFLFGCDRKSSNSNCKWTSSDPLSIPLDVRELEFEKGNIIKNNSFEEGRELKNDSLIKNFEIKGWEKIGKNVEWVNSESDVYNEDQVNEGSRSVKIHRKFKDAKEYDNHSEGILSDFIKVIPGNYLFTYDIKLKRIFPATRRLASKISDEIDVHFKFYDNKKIEIKPGIFYEYYGKEVDNSFKANSFSNFYYIEKFDWGRIIGRTMDYPFSDGDIPDGCEYVKIFLGLKARGTMYVDNVDLHFSRWNFTTLERLTPFFENEYKKSDFITPKPKLIGEETIIDCEKLNPVILLPKNQTNSDKSAVNLIKERTGIKDIKTVVGNIATDNKDQIVFSIGKNDLYKKYKNKLELSKIEGHSQGYVIKMIEDGSKLIFLVGNEDVGSYYAATTFVQLIDDEKFTYHHSDIFDYPDFTGRSYHLTGYKNRWRINKDTSLSKEKKAEAIEKLEKAIISETNNVKRYAFYKMNKMYNGYGDLTTRWWDPGKHYDDIFASIGDECKKIGGIAPCVQINPYYHFEYESEEEKLPDSLRNMFSHSNPKDIQKVKAVIKRGLDRGAKTVMVCADDFVPHSGTTRGIYSLFTDSDKKAYFNMAQAQMTMMHDIQNWLDKNYKDVRLEFCPAPYLNGFIDYGMGSAEAFFRDLTSHAPKDMAVIWTGNTVRTLTYDVADIKRYTDLIKVKPMLWDNTPYARALEGEYGGYPAHYPKKSVMCNLFEAYDIIIPPNFSELMDSHIYTNGGSGSECTIMKNATFADFAWNSKEYDADFSLYKNLVSVYGKEDAMKLLKFNDQYFKLVSVWSEIRNGKENEKEANSYILTEDIKAKGEAIILELGNIYDDLAKTNNNQLMVDELKKVMDAKIKKYREILEKDAEDKVGHRQT